MKSSYKRLGEYIEPVDEFNVGNEIKQLLGISNKKHFQKSQTNTIGIDLAKYRVVRDNHFAFNRATTRNSDKISVALRQGGDCIVSPSYRIFRSKDENKLNSEYLWMWFRRPEFDRYARFKSHGSAHEFFDMDEMNEVMLPIPHITKQREIVAEYNTIQNRIKLNEQLIQKLEETAQAIYREWFVEFEFLDENGKPYKSNGGALVWNDELEKEIPKGWEVIELKEVIENYDSKRIPLAGNERANRERKYPYYGAASLMDYIDEYIFNGSYILLGEDGTVVTEKGTPVLQYVWGKFWVNNHAHVLKGRNGFDENSLYVLLSNTNITDIITGGVQAKINQANLNSIPIIKSNSELLDVLNKTLKPIFELFKNKKTENQKLTELKALLLSKMATVEN